MAENGRRALVTGAGQGMGAAIAQRLAAADVTVVVNDVRAERAEEVAARLPGAVPAVADVTDYAAVRKMVDEYGPLDILVNNAGNAGIEGLGVMGPFVETEPDEWERWLRVNLYGVMHVARAVLPGMLERSWGRIVTIISDAGRAGDPRQSVYAAAKAGAAGFSRSLAREVGRRGITVNCVSLGSISHREPVPEDERYQRMVRFYPVGRTGKPDDVAPMVAFLCSDDAEWITGQTYPVNGGYTLSL